MNVAAASLILAAIFLWGVISARVAAISTPIFFVATGLALAEGLRLVHVEADPHSTKLIAEVTLVWVLFADASRVRFSALRADFSRYLQLLALGLPLTIAFGTATGGRGPGHQSLVRAAACCRPSADRCSSWLGGHVGPAGSFSGAANAQCGEWTE